MIIEALVTIFVVGFIALTLLGHVLLGQALITPDQGDEPHIGL